MRTIEFNGCLVFEFHITCFIATNPSNFQGPDFSPLLAFFIASLLVLAITVPEENLSGFLSLLIPQYVYFIL